MAIRAAGPSSPDESFFPYQEPGVHNLDAIATYYDEMTDSYMEYAGEGLGWHFGVWDADTQSLPDSVANGTRTLIGGVPLQPGDRVLDLGCGVGGLAAQILAHHDVHVVGVTICPRHRDLAEEIARGRGYADRVTFVCADFASLDLPAASFAAAFNHESFCYVRDHAAYLRGVYRLLAPGGRWRCAEGFLAPGPLTERGAELHEHVQTGYVMEPLARIADVERALTLSGFTDLAVHDLTPRVAPTAELFTRLAEMYYGWRDGGARPAFGPTKEAHIKAGESFSRGLLEGAFVYATVEGRRPA